MPKLSTIKPAPASGSGPGGRVQISDIRSKLTEIRGEVEETTETVKPYALAGGVAAVVLLVAAAFLLGRGRGKRKATWVEIRRL